jgi:integrase
MNVRHQRGHLRCVERKNGAHRWEFLWRETDAAGKRIRRNAVIGAIDKYPTEALAQAAINGLRTCINDNRNRQRQQPIFVGDLIDHYLATELGEETDWRSHATRIVYREFLTRWIRPHWGSTNIRDVRTVVVERWLRHLQRQDGEALANSTKAKIRNLMSVLFNHAIRYEWLEQGKNPMTLVRQGALRKLTPTVLEPHEIQSLLSELESPFRVMVLVGVTTGLRRSELFALQWSDIDFCNLTIEIKRSIFQGVIGNCKTEASRRPVPLSLEVAADLWLWKECTLYSKPNDWIFASSWAKGSKPFWPNTLLRKIIRPAAVRAGIKKRIGWHTFRHTYATILIANGENVKVVQELMRHANSRYTLDVYTQARISAKREAQQRIVQMILPEEGLISETRMQKRDPDECLGDAE